MRLERDRQEGGLAQQQGSDGVAGPRRDTSGRFIYNTKFLYTKEIRPIRCATSLENFVRRIVNQRPTKEERSASGCFREWVA
jgi:hypothetical protein